VKSPVSAPRFGDARTRTFLLCRPDFGFLRFHQNR